MKGALLCINLETMRVCMGSQKVKIKLCWVMEIRAILSCAAARMAQAQKKKTLCTILLHFQAGDTQCVSMCTCREMSRPWRYVCTCREKSRPACVRVEKCLVLGRFRLGDVLNVERESVVYSLSLSTWEIPLVLPILASRAIQAWRCVEC